MERALLSKSEGHAVFYGSPTCSNKNLAMIYHFAGIYSDI